MARRVRVGCPATLVFGQQSVPAICLNLSASGAGFRVERSPRLGAMVNVRVELPSGDNVSAEAEVVRIYADEDTIGLRFLHLSQASLAAIHEFLSDRR